MIFFASFYLVQINMSWYKSRTGSKYGRKKPGLCNASVLPRLLAASCHCTGLPVTGETRVSPQWKASLHAALKYDKRNVQKYKLLEFQICFCFHEEKRGSKKLLRWKCTRLTNEFINVKCQVIIRIRVVINTKKNQSGSLVSLVCLSIRYAYTKRIYLSYKSITSR